MALVPGTQWPKVQHSPAPHLRTVILSPTRWEMLGSSVKNRNNTDIPGLHSQGLQPSGFQAEQSICTLQNLPGRPPEGPALRVKLVGQGRGLRVELLTGHHLSSGWDSSGHISGTVLSLAGRDLRDRYKGQRP